MQCSINPLSLEEVLGSLSSLVTVESLEFIRFIFFGGLYLPLTQELTSIMTVTQSLNHYTHKLIYNIT